MSSTTKPVLSLYRSLLKAGKNFKDYNFRDHAVRRIKHEFRANSSVTDPAKVTALLADGAKQLDVVNRQVTVNNMYHTGSSFVDMPEAKAIIL